MTQKKRLRKTPITTTGGGSVRQFMTCRAETKTIPRSLTIPVSKSPYKIENYAKHDVNEVLTVRRTHDHSGLHEVLVRRVPPRSIYPGRRRMSKKDASRSLGDFTGNTVAEVGSKKGESLQPRPAPARRGWVVVGSKGEVKRQK